MRKSPRDHLRLTRSFRIANECLKEPADPLSPSPRQSISAPVNIAQHFMSNTPGQQSVTERINSFLSANVGAPPTWAAILNFNADSVELITALDVVFSTVVAAARTIPRSPEIAYGLTMK